MREKLFGKHEKLEEQRDRDTERMRVLHERLRSCERQVSDYRAQVAILDAEVYKKKKESNRDNSEEQENLDIRKD